MEFRRSTNPAPRGTIRRKGALLIVSIGLLALLVYLVIQEYNRGQTAILKVEMLSNNQYRVDSRTTNFEKLASTLRQEAFYWRSQQRTYEIHLKLPPNTNNSDTLRAVVQLVSAFDVTWQLKQ